MAARGALWIAALLLLGVAGDAGAQNVANAGGSLVYVAPAAADPELEAVAEGFASWLRHRLGNAGIATSPREPSGAVPPAVVLERAAELGASYALVPVANGDRGAIDLGLVLYEPSSGRLLGASRSQKPLAEVGAAAEDVSVRALARLGVPDGSVTLTQTPRVEELAAAGRALRLRDAGDLVGAWREVEGKLSPTAARTREALLVEARSGAGGIAQRARMLAAAGEAETARTLLGTLPRDQRGRAENKLAAAEVQLARNNPRQARPFFEAVIQQRPDDADAHRGLARVLELQNDRAGARRALARAAELDPRHTRTFEVLAQADRRRPTRGGEWLLRAGVSEAQRLNPHRADALLGRAAQADPALADEAWQARATMQAELGHHADSLETWRRAEESGAEVADVQRGVGDSQRALGDTAAAEAAYSAAVTAAPKDAEALTALGSLYTESDRAAEAVLLLERAVKAAPKDAEVRRGLADALRASNQPARALKVLGPPDRGGAESLALAARIHSEQGRHENASEALDRALDELPYAVWLQQRGATLARERGDGAAAEELQEIADLLSGASDDVVTEGALLAARTNADGLSFEELIASFGVGRKARSRAVAWLGLRDAPGWQGHLVRWLHPREPARGAIDAALRTAIAGHFTGRVDLDPATQDAALRREIERLYDLDADRSLEAETVASVNHTLRTEAAFVARIELWPGEARGAQTRDPRCAEPGRFALRIRLLGGSHPDLASILRNVECIPGRAEAYTAWNPRALAIYGVLMLGLLYPVLRGWGSVRVKIVLPPKTKGFFSIRVAKNPDEMPTDQKKKGSGRLMRSLRSLSRFEKHMAGRDTTFRWIPVRRAYHVTVKGPLLDATGDEIIGHFLETKTVRVKRRAVAQLEYDFRPKECAVELKVLWNDEPAPGAQLAFRGDRSLRYARDGNAIIPLGKGHYELLVGLRDRVAEVSFEIRALEKPIQVWADLSDGSDLVFSGCPAAVEPYLQGDCAGAADALVAAGETQAAHLLRAEHHRSLGENERAATELEEAGRFDEAAELRVASSDFDGSAALFEKAGDFTRAAEAYRGGGDVASAARCYESAYDYENALDCYREAGDVAKQSDILEKTGAYLEAADLARRSGDADRALRNLQFIGRRDHTYGDACKLSAEILADRGQHELAAEKLGEAVDEAGGANAPAPMHERLAEILTLAGMTERALDAYQTVRRLEPSREDVNEKVAALQREVELARSAAGASDDSQTAPIHAPQAVPSRYEIQGELGRGAMGLVYRALDTHLGRVVALKRLPDNLRDHPTAIALFRREAQAAAVLNHPNIVTVFDAGEENGHYFLTMELLEGFPLNAVLKQRGVLGARDTARLGVQIGAGLNYAHEKRIVHRDIKTANLFFTRDKVVKIMDFGLAKTIEEVRKASTVIGGTPYFMAPEQAAGDDLDHRADLYAFGVTLFQLATGTVPFREGDLAYHHRHTPPPDPRQLAPGMPDALANVILQLLAKDPEDRPDSAAEVSLRLQALLT